MSEAVDMLAAAKASGDNGKKGAGLLKMAGAHIARDENEDGMNALNEAQNIFGDERNESGVAMAGALMAKIWIRRGDTDEAQSNGNDALKRFQKAKNSKGEGYALIVLSSVAEAKGDSNAMLKRGQAAVEIFSTLGEVELCIQACKCCIGGHLGNFDTFEAASSAEHAASLCESLGDTKRQAEFILEVARIETQANDVEKATDMIKKALALFYQTGNVLGQAEALNVFIALHQAKENLAQVIKTSQDVCKLLEKNQLYSELAYALLRLGQIYMDAEIVEEANSKAEKAMGIFFELKDKQGMEMTKEFLKKCTHQRYRLRIIEVLESYGEFCSMPSTLIVDPGMQERIKEEYMKGVGAK
eukprot:gnl/TRDRNA2_/TRDRNA2_179688_c0_seq1.p1 gnl/TRDRNA2_/TRDRNA2_179688_c0~~gnl/TRDRNA2_/TRDRNA2_179688_c0_seq1.p1  ORF type:complete len:406 (-),score=131.25 gnl/TRDRNA2_/TRDRNA2_179688_c0_seq1:178-1251(-)